MSETPTPLLILVNPTAAGGRARRLLPAVERRLGELGARYRVVVTRSADHAVSEALAAAEAGETPVMMGGDGLIGAVGGALAGGAAPIGIIPCGRGNDLARVLGVPGDPEAAAELAATGSPVRIDVGEANGVRFLGIASAGFDSDANAIANRARVLRGRAVYAYGALRALAGWKPAQFQLRTDTGSFTFSGYSVAAANSRAYGGGMYMAPDASLTDGLLDVVTVGRSGKLHFLASLPKVFRGTHPFEPEVDVHRTSTLELSASRDFDLYADGERLAELPAVIRLLPGALGVIAPGPPP